MKLPRDITGTELIRGLRRIGYEVERQAGSHIILRCSSPRTHSVTVPNHRPIKVGTLSTILCAVCEQRSLPIEALLDEMKL